MQHLSIHCFCRTLKSISRMSSPFVTPSRVTPNRVNSSSFPHRPIVPRSGGSPASAGLQLDSTTCQDKILDSLKSLQDLIAELKSLTSSSSAAATAAELPKEKKIAKELSSAIHSTVKHLRDQIDNAMEWNTSLRYMHVHQSHRSTVLMYILTKFHRYCEPVCDRWTCHCLSKRQISRCCCPKYAMMDVLILKLLLYTFYHSCRSR